MVGRMNYARAKHSQRMREHLRGTAPQEHLAGYPQTSLRGWRLTDGREHPVTITRIDASKERPDD